MSLKFVTTADAAIFVCDTVVSPPDVYYLSPEALARYLQDWERQAVYQAMLHDAYAVLYCVEVVGKENQCLGLTRMQTVYQAEAEYQVVVRELNNGQTVYPYCVMKTVGSAGEPGWAIRRGKGEPIPVVGSP